MRTANQRGGGSGKRGTTEAADALQRKAAAGGLAGLLGGCSHARTQMRIPMRARVRTINTQMPPQVVAAPAMADASIARSVLVDVTHAMDAIAVMRTSRRAHAHAMSTTPRIVAPRVMATSPAAGKTGAQSAASPQPGGPKSALLRLSRPRQTHMSGPSTTCRSAPA